MSTCIEDLFDYEFAKKCSKSGIVKMKRDFLVESILKGKKMIVYKVGVVNIKNGSIKSKKKLKFI